MVPGVTRATGRAMPRNLVFAVLAGVPFGMALAALILMQPPSIPLMLGSAAAG